MGERIDRLFEWLAVWVLAVSGIGLISALLDQFMAPQVLLLSVLVTCLYAWCSGTAPAALSATPAKWPHLVTIILVGLFFRLPAYNYVLGGQDEGVYVNVSHHIEHTGGVQVRDRILDDLHGTGLAVPYLKDNRSVHGTHAWNVSFLPGVYAHDDTTDRLEFQFYHLFPVWMALVSGVFGPTLGIYALTFFALLSLLSFYRLVLVVSGKPRVALAAGLLLAVSPLHAFFSKFPVTEVPTLAFSLTGFAFLAGYWSATPERRNWRWLMISAGCFGALFATRISGFMYMPFVVALGMAEAVADTDASRRRAIGVWCVSVVVLYAVSVAYGLHWSRAYADDIYRTSFDRIFGRHWLDGVIATSIATVGVWVAVVLSARHAQARNVLHRYALVPARWLVGGVLLAALLLGVVKAYLLGWTQHYAYDVGLNHQWHLVAKGWASVRATSLYQLLVFMGPLLPLCYLLLAWRPHADARLDFLRIFVAGFFVYIALLQWVIPYSPYYDRYLLSELVPYLLLFVVLCWSGTSRQGVQWLLAMAILVSGLYAARVSGYQLGKRESAGLYAQLKALVAPVDSRDLILLDSQGPGLPNGGELKTPLIYTFHKNVVIISRKHLDDGRYVQGLNSYYDDLFLITPTPRAPKGFELLGSKPVEVWAFRWTHSYPRTLFPREDMRLYIYRFASPVVPLDTPVSFSSSGAWNGWLDSGWSQPESWGVWSEGQHARLVISPRQLPGANPNDALVLQIHASAFVTPSHPQQHLVVTVNGVPASTQTATYPDANMTINVRVTPRMRDSTRKIVIGFELPNAISPKDAGVNGDQRVVALGLRRVLVKAVPGTIQ